MLTIIGFLIWMTFFANNDFIRQYRIGQKKKEMTAELNRRKALIRDTNEELEELKHKNLLEKFAREQYLFKKTNEEIYVITEKGELK